MVSPAVVETERAVVKEAGVRALGRKAVVVWKALAVTSWMATLHALIVCWRSEFYGRNRNRAGEKDGERSAVASHFLLFQG